MERKTIEPDVLVRDGKVVSDWTDIDVNDPEQAEAVLEAESGAVVEVTAASGEDLDGIDGNGVVVKVVDEGDSLDASYEEGVLTVDLGGEDRSAGDIASEIDGLDEFDASEEESGDFTTDDDVGLSVEMAGGLDKHGDYLEIEEAQAEHLLIAVDNDSGEDARLVMEPGGEWAFRSGVGEKKIDVEDGDEVVVAGVESARHQTVDGKIHLHFESDDWDNVSDGDIELRVWRLP